MPFVAASLLLAAPSVPEHREVGRQQLDLPGQLLGALGLLRISSGLIEGPRSGIVTGGALVSVGLGAGAVFLRREAHTAAPMMPLSLFRSRAFSAAVGGAGLMTFGFYAFLFALPFTGPISHEGVTRAPPDRAGAGSGLINTARLVGATMSVALEGLFHADRTAGPEAVAAATRGALVMAAAAEGLGALVAVAFMRPRSPADMRLGLGGRAPAERA